MKKAFYFGIICLVLLIINACTSVSTNPHLYTSNTSAEYIILGEIVYESNDHIGYTELLRAARRLYPDCDYVIDLMIDRREIVTTVFFIRTVKDVTWIMRGTAIQYKR